MMNKPIRRLSIVLLIVMCLASLSVTAYAYADDAGPEYILETTEPVAVPTEPTEPTTDGCRLSGRKTVFGSGELPAAQKVDCSRGQVPPPHF